LTDIAADSILATPGMGYGPDPGHAQGRHEYAREQVYFDG